jgi:ubiquinol-cytochrome c reductase iron-sulfur subunit
LCLYANFITIWRIFRPLRKFNGRKFYIGYYGQWAVMGEDVMSDDAVNTGRRRLLTVATSAVGAVGVVGVAVPFVGSWNPSAKAKAAGAPVKADLSKLEPGAMVIVEWRGKPVYVVRRTAAQIASLAEGTENLKDPSSAEPQQPEYVDKSNRAIKSEFLILVGICTHLGCAPKHVETIAPELLGNGVGGFFCPCHGSRFDLAGRVLNGSPASLNLVIPPHRYVSDGVVIIGEDQEAA